MPPLPQKPSSAPAAQGAEPAVLAPAVQAQMDQHIEELRQRGRTTMPDSQLIAGREGEERIRQWYTENPTGQHERIQTNAPVPPPTAFQQWLVGQPEIREQLRNNPAFRLYYNEGQGQNAMMAEKTVATLGRDGMAMLNDPRNADIRQAVIDYVIKGEGMDDLLQLKDKMNGLERVSRPPPGLQSSPAPGLGNAGLSPAAARTESLNNFRSWLAVQPDMQDPMRAASALGNMSFNTLAATLHTTNLVDTLNDPQNAALRNRVIEFVNGGDMHALPQFMQDVRTLANGATPAPAQAPRMSRPPETRPVTGAPLPELTETTYKVREQALNANAVVNARDPEAAAAVVTALMTRQPLDKAMGERVNRAFESYMKENSADAVRTLAQLQDGLGVAARQTLPSSRVLDPVMNQYRREEAARSLRIVTGAEPPSQASPSLPQKFEGAAGTPDQRTTSREVVQAPAGPAAPGAREPVPVVTTEITNVRLASPGGYDPAADLIQLQTKLGLKPTGAMDETTRNAVDKLLVQAQMTGDYLKQKDVHGHAAKVDALYGPMTEKALQTLNIDPAMAEAMKRLNDNRALNGAKSSPERLAALKDEVTREDSAFKPALEGRQNPIVQNPITLTTAPLNPDTAKQADDLGQKYMSVQEKTPVFAAWRTESPKAYGGHDVREGPLGSNIDAVTGERGQLRATYSATLQADSTSVVSVNPPGATPAVFVQPQPQRRSDMTVAV